MKKVILGYDPQTGSITDINGYCVATYSGLLYEEATEKETDVVHEMIKLKNAGFTAEEIVLFKNEGVL